MGVFLVEIGERKPNVDQPAFGQTEFRKPIDQFSCVVRGGGEKMEYWAGHERPPNFFQILRGATL